MFFQWLNPKTYLGKSRSFQHSAWSSLIIHSDQICPNILFQMSQPKQLVKRELLELKQGQVELRWDLLSPLLLSRYRRIQHFLGLPQGILPVLHALSSPLRRCPGMHPNQMSKPHQLAPPCAEEQQLSSEFPFE